MGEVEMKDAGAVADTTGDTKKKNVTEEAKADECILAMDVDKAE